MVTNEYKVAYSEVLEILKYISRDEYNKIPIDMVEMFKANATNNNNFVYNPNKTLQEQNVSKTARAIIAILFRDYWATEEQRNKIKAFQNNKRNQIEEENRQKYEVFKNRTNIANAKEIEQAENMQLVEYKENIFKKILGFFKKMFRK